MTTDLEDLARRVEAADGADRRLDGLITAALGLDHDRSGFKPECAFRYEADEDDGSVTAYSIYEGVERKIKRYQPRPFTASLDAAMTLVPEGALFTARTLWDGDRRAGFASVSLYEDGEFGGHKRRYWMGEHQGTAATPALALVAAALRARAASITKETSNAR